MKKLIAAMVPEKLMPVAQKIHRKLFAASCQPDFSQTRYKALNALKCTVSYNKYGGYCVPDSSRHRPAAQKILSNDVHEPETIELIRSRCADGDVVHAGTYFGDFLPALSESAAPGAKIWAFEPNRENYRCARITLEINDISNAILTNAGVGAKREQLLLQVADEDGQALGGASRLAVGTSSKGDHWQTVQIVTIDDMIGSDRDVSIIQLDVEGHEKEALVGSLATIRRCRPTLILEVLPGSTLLESDWFARNLRDLGYRETDRVHGNFVFSCASGSF